MGLYTLSFELQCVSEESQRGFIGVPGSFKDQCGRRGVSDAFQGQRWMGFRGDAVSFKGIHLIFEGVTGGIRDFPRQFMKFFPKVLWDLTDDLRMGFRSVSRRFKAFQGASNEFPGHYGASQAITGSRGISEGFRRRFKYGVFNKVDLDIKNFDELVYSRIIR